MATSLQMQLNETILSPQGLLTTLQQNGLAVTTIFLRSLDVEQVGRTSKVLDKACSMFLDTLHVYDLCLVIMVYDIYVIGVHEGLRLFCVTCLRKELFLSDCTAIMLTGSA